MAPILYISFPFFSCEIGEPYNDHREHGITCLPRIESTVIMSASFDL
jgi:hypothetical protein